MAASLFADEFSKWCLMSFPSDEFRGWILLRYFAWSASRSAKQEDESFNLRGNYLESSASFPRINFARFYEAAITAISDDNHKLSLLSRKRLFAITRTFPRDFLHITRGKICNILKCICKMHISYRKICVKLRDAENFILGNKVFKLS